MSQIKVFSFFRRNAKLQFKEANSSLGLSDRTCMSHPGAIAPIYQPVYSRHFFFFKISSYTTTGDTVYYEFKRCSRSLVSVFSQDLTFFFQISTFQSARDDAKDLPATFDPALWAGRNF